MWLRGCRYGRGHLRGSWSRPGVDQIEAHRDAITDILSEYTREYLNGFSTDFLDAECAQRGC